MKTAMKEKKQENKEKKVSPVFTAIGVKRLSKIGEYLERKDTTPQAEYIDWSAVLN